MRGQLLDGKRLAELRKQQLKEKIQQHILNGHLAPGLAVILVGNQPASEVYVRNKRQACEYVGIRSIAYDLPTTISQGELLQQVEQLNRDPHINGILIQLPLPDHIDSNAILESIHPDKDVDGFHPYNIGRLAQRRPLLRPCTPLGIINLLESVQLNLAGLDAVIVGASNIVGRPMALELLLAAATVTICHRFTANMAEQVKRADLLVAAIGKPGVIQTEWLKPGVIVVDVGINRLANGRLIGDIDFPSAKEKASWITPVPGGVGPMTVITLLENTWYAATR